MKAILIGILVKWYTEYKQQMNVVQELVNEARKGAWEEFGA